MKAVIGSLFCVQTIVFIYSTIYFKMETYSIEKHAEKG